MPVTEILGIEANSPEAFTDSQYLYIDSGTENIYPPGQNDLVSRART